jgi:ribonuclease HI
MPTTKINHLIIHADGGSRGNPGPAAIGVHATTEGDLLFDLSLYIGETTNNVAEWQAVIKALEHLVKQNIKASQIDFYLDSELVVKQVIGQYKVKQPHLQLLAIQVHQLTQQLSSSKISYHHVPREQNKQADSLVNQALDQLS